MQVFKGFQFQMPVYTVITPQTGETYGIRSMTVAEVNSLKTSLVTPNKIHNLINRIIWECISERPSHIVDPVSFKRNTTTLDREALLYGLYHSTFGNTREFSVQCANCDFEQLLKVDMDKIFSFNAFPGSRAVKDSYKASKAIDKNTPVDMEVEANIAAADMKKDKRSAIEKALRQGKKLETVERRVDEEDNDELDGNYSGTAAGVSDAAGGANTVPQPRPSSPVVAFGSNEFSPPEPQNITSVLNKLVPVELPISKVVAVVRQPTLMHEEEILGSMSFAKKESTDLLTETLIIERFEEYRVGDKAPYNIITNREDIFYGYMSLPPLDKKEIFDKYEREFGQYCIELKTNYPCQRCGFENKLNLSIAEQFFRMVANL